MVPVVGLRPLRVMMMMGGLGEGDPQLASVVRYSAAIEVVCGAGLGYRDRPVPTVCETHLRETGDVHSVLQERAFPSSRRHIISRIRKLCHA